MKTSSCLVMLAFFPMVFVGCSSAEQSRPTQVAAPRAVGGIIVKPKKPPTDSAALMKVVSAQLTSPERVTFLRAMSGDAYVLNVMPPATKADIASIVAQLTASGLFEYVEEDQMMTTQR
jgi:hypothetical protein